MFTRIARVLLWILIGLVVIAAIGFAVFGTIVGGGFQGILAGILILIAGFIVLFFFGIYVELVNNVLDIKKTLVDIKNNSCIQPNLRPQPVVQAQPLPVSQPTVAQEPVAAPQPTVAPQPVVAPEPKIEIQDDAKAQAAPTQDIVFCTKCGRDNSKEFKFCQDCGAPLTF